MSPPLWLSRLGDWFFRTLALREARREIAEFGEARVRAAEQARLLMEVAGRVAEPAQSLPSGSRPAVMIGLFRDALTWALASEQPNPETLSEFATLWAQADRKRLLRLAGDEAALSNAERWLLADSPTAWLKASERDAANVRRFSEAVVLELDRFEQRLDQLRAQRVIRVAMLAALIASLGLAVSRLPMGPDLAKGKPFVTSSANPTCNQPGKCQGLLFHTQEERDPWVEFDLGAPHTVRRVEVRNRADCCAERAVPLVVELSTDRGNFTEVARIDEDFSEKVAKFSAQKARYVRLRVPRTSLLHLEAVTIR